MGSDLLVSLINNEGSWSLGITQNDIFLGHKPMYLARKVGLFMNSGERALLSHMWEHASAITHHFCSRLENYILPYAQAKCEI